MSEEPEENEESTDEDEEEGAGEAESKGRFGAKTLLIFGLPPLLILLGGGFFVAAHFGWFESGPDQKVVQSAAVYLDMPEMVVNLSNRDERAQYLKIKVSLEAKNKVVLDALEPVMPRILDMFQVYLRELRSSDLDGSAGIFRLKEELLRRINLTIHPNRIDRVLFKEIIVQ